MRTDLDEHLFEGAVGLLQTTQGRHQVGQSPVLGHDPVIMLEAPIPATQKALDRAGIETLDANCHLLDEQFMSLNLSHFHFFR